MGSPYDYKAEFLDMDGYVLTNTEVTFIINGKEYKVKTDDQGIAYLHEELPVGTYDITIINPATGENATKKTTIVPRIVENKDLTMDYKDKSQFVVRAIGDDGISVGAGEVVRISVNKIHYAPVTDKDGYAKLTINLIPKSYTISAQYRGYKSSNKLKVKVTLN